jgi:predicted dehydrogenase
MSKKMGRREFLGTAAQGAGAIGLAASALSRTAAAQDKFVRVGVIGTGNRGKSLAGTMLAIPGVSVLAVCDIDATNLAAGQDLIEKGGQKRPEAYTGDDYAYRKLLERDDLDAVVIATPWHWHTPMAVDSMKAGKATACEVPAAMTFEDCWLLVDTQESTGTPCMMLENWSFRQDNLAVLNMIRQGVLGEIMHCHCAHSHDCIDHWFFDTEGNIRWGGEYLVKYNRDQYPTHSMGPVLSWMDINCGDAFATCTSTATRSRGINAYFARKFGADHPNAKREYKQGDIVTSVIRTQGGKSIVVNYDMQLPRPYDNRWMIQGTLGLYDEARSSVYLEGKSPKYHEWEPFPPYQEQYNHKWWKDMATTSDGHGGTDYLELRQFLDAVRNGTPTPIDIYDSVTMCSVIPMSEKSIAGGSAPVECPDFTRGKWKTRKPYFALET